jgi:glycine cleavage system H protein
MEKQETKRQETKGCPLLREERVIFCKAFPLKKMLAFDRICKNENRCFKKEGYIDCPLYDKDMVTGSFETGICPFVGIDILSYCSAFPLKKIACNTIMPSPCNSKRYEECSMYKGMAYGRVKEEKKRLTNVHGFLLDETKEYTEGHLWIKRINGVTRIGIDDFGQFTLGNVKEVFSKEKGEKVTKGFPIIRFLAECAEVELPSPIYGSVERLNDKVLKNPSLLNTDPYGEGWLLEAKIEGEIETIDAIKTRFWLEREITMLREVVENRIGISLPDGGEFVRETKPLFGEKALMLVKTFLIRKEG